VVPAPASELADRLGVSFTDPHLLEQALIHSSYVNEHAAPGVVANERLEFLGDAVLSLIISEALWSRHPDEPEGLLTTRRAAIVSAAGLARIADRLDLGRYIVLGQGAERSGERWRGSVLASAFEALVAAVYLDLGIDAARDLVVGIAAPELDAAAPPLTLKSPKSQLQELSYGQHGRPPTYRVLTVSGPDHAREYRVEVVVSGRVLGEGAGRNRREAETVAAAQALAVLAEDPLRPPGAGQPMPLPDAGSDDAGRAASLVAAPDDGDAADGVAR
jgi:ribonuclease-3